MIELKGKYNEAKIFTDVVDEASISQVMLLLNQEFVSESKIRLMPDIHAGAGCTIGTTMTISDKVVPNLVGVDIFTVSEFKKQMKDVYTTSVNKDTLDECPMAYKGMDDILNNIGDTVDVERVIKTIYNFKAGGD